MAINIIILFFIVALVALFCWLAWRAWRTKRGILKFGGAVLSGLFGLIFILLTVLLVIGLFKLYAPRGNPVVGLEVERTLEQTARGEHIAQVVCSSCHTLEGTLPLSGGKDLAEEIPIPIGSFTPPNLTPAGRIKDWSDGELARAIREGTNPGGHLMAIMSSNTFYELSESDLRSVIAYLRSQTPVQKETPNERFTPLGVIMAGAGMLPIKPVPSPQFPTAPPKGPTAEYGAYITRYLDCALCHGKDLRGGPGGLVPAGPSLRPVKSWTQEQFVSTLRTGVTIGGRALDPDKMPWEFFGKLDNEGWPPCICTWPACSNIQTGHDSYLIPW